MPEPEKITKAIEPEAGESESDFMGRCVPLEVNNGHEQDQAVAMCMSMFGKSKAEKEAKEKAEAEAKTKAETEAKEKAGKEATEKAEAEKKAQEKVEAEKKAEEEKSAKEKEWQEKFDKPLREGKACADGDKKPKK